MNRTGRLNWTWKPALMGVSVLAALGMTQCQPTTGEADGPPGDPVAVIVNVGLSNAIQLGESVELDGNDSRLGENTDDLDLDLTFFWAFDSRPGNSELVDESLAPIGDDEAHILFTPDVEGLYGVTLQVSDGARVSDLRHLLITVGGGNGCPIADAGADIVAQTGTPITLDGTASDDGDDELEEQSLDYTWHFSLTPSASQLDDGDIFYQGSARPVIIPDAPGTYILQLRTSDGICTSLPDYVTIQASNGNRAPTADAGQSLVLTPCSSTEVTLDGSGSFDPEGVPLNFEWRFTTVPNGSGVSDAFLQNRFSSSPSFNRDVPGIYTLELRVDDGEVESEPDYVAIQAVASLPNAGPTAFAGDDVVVEATAACVADAYTGGTCNPCGSRSIVLDAGGSIDPDGDALNYQWDLQSGNAELLGIESEVLEVTLPALDVPYGGVSELEIDIALTVFDCRAADDDVVRVTFVCTGG